MRKSSISTLGIIAIILKIISIVLEAIGIFKGEE